MAGTSSPPPPDLEDLEVLVLEVFTRVWGEFGVADADYCEAAIGSLTATSVAKDDLLSAESESVLTLFHDIHPSISRSSNVDESIPESSKPHTPRVYPETGIPTLALPQAVKPYPEYESWAPTDRSIFLGDDANDLHFLPFADEPDFDKKVYRNFFKTLAWQSGKQMDVERESFLLWRSWFRPAN